MSYLRKFLTKFYLKKNTRKRFFIIRPTSSEDEGLPNQFYDAENNGINGNCAEYNSHCPNNMLDTISKTMFLK